MFEGLGQRWILNRRNRPLEFCRAGQLFDTQTRPDWLLDLKAIYRQIRQVTKRHLDTRRSASRHNRSLQRTIGASCCSHRGRLHRTDTSRFNEALRWIHSCTVPMRVRFERESGKKSLCTAIANYQRCRPNGPPSRTLRPTQFLSMKLSASSKKKIEYRRY